MLDFEAARAEATNGVIPASPPVKASRFGHLEQPFNGFGRGIIS
jgi:hypothetical protein